MNKHLVIHSEVARALKNARPVVALESTLITHGLPYPENLELAAEMEQIIRQEGATPATIAVLQGKVHVGLDKDELEKLAQPGEARRKISARDFGIVLARGESGGTTVAATMIAAHASGIKVFATGGIGGVHRGASYDVSADLPQLGSTPLIVVCAGAKAILDLPATIEYLETLGVPVIGYQTDEFPAFYSRDSGLPVTVRADTPAEIVRIARAQWEMGILRAVLVANPLPVELALPAAEIEEKIQVALQEAQQSHITGAAVTPFLLRRVSELSQRKSLEANLALLHHNARLGAQIACEFVPEPRVYQV
ncbi:MAG: pseudouridine-5'-phosphate glycosidase [Anaerolineae bacterium]|nr:pseudouridine-5'-phosphate glycosidase [Anaerolineae bacterium]